MKKLLFGVLTFALIITSCVKDDLADLNKKIDDLNAKITALATQVAGVATLQTGLVAAQAQLTALTTAVAALPSTASTAALSAILATITTNVNSISTALGTLATNVAAGNVTTQGLVNQLITTTAANQLATTALVNSVRADLTTAIGTSNTAQTATLTTLLASATAANALAITAAQDALTLNNASQTTALTALITAMQASLAIQGAKIDLIMANTATTPVRFTALAANGTTLLVSTTSLTLTFDTDPAALTAANITVTGATKGTLSGTGNTRTLAISGITVANGENVTVAIANPWGLTITNDGTAAASRTVPVWVAPAVTFSALAANGASNVTTTTSLTLTFTGATLGTIFTADNITVTGATKGALTGTGNTRTLAISGITVANGANVTVALTQPSGFNITPTSLTVPVWVLATPVAFSNLTADGASGTVQTTILTLTFDVDPVGLVAANITVTGATRGALSSASGNTRTLAISAITVANGENVTVAIANPAGLAITPSSRTVPVWVAPAVTFSNLTADGASNVTTTTSLTLTFTGATLTTTNTELEALITVTGATKGTLSGTVPGNTRTLTITAITAVNGANVTVAIAQPSGFNITPTSLTVPVWIALTQVSYVSAVAANGSDFVPTTSITLTFSADPVGLAAANITVTGATKGALTGSGNTRTLAISGITVPDNGLVTVALTNPTGFWILPTSRTAAVRIGATP